MVAANGRVHALLPRYSLDGRAGIANVDAASGNETSFFDFSAVKANLLTTHWLQYDGASLVAVYPFTATGWSQGDRYMVIVGEGNGAPRWRGPMEWFPALRLYDGQMLGMEGTAKQVDGKRVPSLHLKKVNPRVGRAAWMSEALFTDPSRWDVESNGFEIPAIDPKANRVYTTGGCVGLEDGKTVWRQDRSRHRNPPVWLPTVALRGGKIFAHGEAWDVNTGQPAWSAARQRHDERGRIMAGWSLTSFTAAGESAVAFAYEDGVIQGVNEADGKVKWEAKTGLPFMGGLAILGNTVYGVSRSGVVAGFDLDTGAEVWRCDLGAPVFAAPIATGNTLFISDWGGNLYAFAGQ
jgi:hypothetical protein